MPAPTDSSISRPPRGRLAVAGACLIISTLAGCGDEAAPPPREVPVTGSPASPPADPDALTRPPRAIATH